MRERVSMSFAASRAVRLMLGASLACIAGVAHAAQNAAADPAQQATEDQGQLEQIVVTAQKVEQNLQDVPDRKSVV